MKTVDLQTLRRRHSTLTYQGYKQKRQENDLLLTFKLHLAPDIDFRPTLLLQNLPDSAFAKLTNPQQNVKLARLIHHIGLAEIPSYYKAACPPQIVIQEVGLSSNAKNWWQDLLINGLGEFYYRNQIDFTVEDWLKIQTTNNTVANDITNITNRVVAIKTVANKTTADSHKNILVPVGGGKDSATVLAILEEKQLPYDILLLAPHAAAALKIAQLMQQQGHCRRIIQVDRQIDPQLLTLNQAGYLNGHTPFSAYLAFVAVTIGYLYDHDEVWLGNETSADEHNLLYLDHAINHQYSKSSIFESKFRSYVKQELFNNSEPFPHYSSLLRPFSELEITAKLCQFADHNPLFKQVLTTLRSCNVGQKQGVWCHHCPKCAFVFAMFAAHLPPQFVSQEIFHENLFAKPSLAKTFAELAGLSDKKPFECVGTFTEMRQAISLSIDNYRRHQMTVPDQLFALHAAIKQDEWMKAMANKSICILGMGREGLSTLAFLRHYWPKKQIGVADKDLQLADTDCHLSRHSGANYLKDLSDYQLIIKTAGIPATLAAIQQAVSSGSQLTSNTELFFTFCPSQHIIGITGTKGKSTTSKLTYEILKQANLSTVLVGNIGQAALNKLIDVTLHTQVVFELSCHQLSSLQVSPHMAVVLDVKSDHLDYYKNFAAYQNAKSSITRFQLPTDYVIYNPQLIGASALAALSPAQAIIHSFDHQDGIFAYLENEQIILQRTGQKNRQVVMQIKDIPLLGQHNLYNVLPAISVAALLNVSVADIRTAIVAFKPLAHRLQQVAKINNVRYIDDSIAVNPHAAIMALRSFPKNKVLLIAGGYERQQDFSELVQVMIEMQVKQIFALPNTGQRLIETVRQQQAALEIRAVDNLERAVQLAKAQAVSGDVVLLSPASASFNDFKNYAMRGDRFAQLVI